MARPFTDLPKIINQSKGRINRGIQRVTREAARKAHETAVLSTRVDQGTARSNWFVTIGSPSFGVIPAYSPGNNLGRGERGNARAAINQGKSVIRTWTINLEASIFITNNVPYIETLNDGRPAVAPDQMKEKAVQAGTLAVRTGLRKALRGR